MEFQIKHSPTGQWFFRIVATGNRRRLAHSENYWNRADAVSAAQLIIDKAGSGKIV